MYTWGDRLCYFKICKTKLNFLTDFRLHELGYDVGTRVTDLYIVRDKNSKRETRLINILLFIKGTIWKVRIKMTKYSETLRKSIFSESLWQRSRQT